MTLDSFLGGKGKKSSKNPTKKSSGKKKTLDSESNDDDIEEKKEDEVELEQQHKKEETIDNELEENKDVSSEKSVELESPPLITKNKSPAFVSVNLSCSSTCGYKKTIKRPKSFTPTEKDLICPKCGKTMKLSR